MEAPTNGLNLRIGGHTSEFRPTVIERATLMIRTVLEAANVRGQWLYMVTGPSTSLRNPSQYCLEVRQASETLTDMVNVIVRASVFPGGTMAGMLKLPSGAERKTLIELLTTCANVFNLSGWQHLLEFEVRERTLDVSPPPEGIPLKRQMHVVAAKVISTNKPARPALAELVNQRTELAAAIYAEVLKEEARLSATLTCDEARCIASRTALAHFREQHAALLVSAREATMSPLSAGKE